MSNIANQLIAVAATLLGFVAHDALTERYAPAAAVAIPTRTAIDPVVTRSVNLDGLSASWLGNSPRAERAAQQRPASRISEATAATRPDQGHSCAELTETRINAARVAAPGTPINSLIR